MLAGDVTGSYRPNTRMNRAMVKIMETTRAIPTGIRATAIDVETSVLLLTKVFNFKFRRQQKFKNKKHIRLMYAEKNQTKERIDIVQAILVSFASTAVPPDWLEESEAAPKRSGLCSRGSSVLAKGLTT